MEEEIKRALETLRRGGVLLYPTDTVWGLGCDATDQKAVSRIYEIKRRADAKSMLALVGSRDMLSRWVENIPQTADMLMDVAVEPLTIIYDRPRGMAPNLPAPDGSMGIRVCSDDFCSRLCLRLGHPLVSTSANVSGEPTPKSYSEISREIIGNADYVIGIRHEERTQHRPSAIIKVCDDETMKVIR